MTLPIPYPGLVIRYAYLWRREAAQGREEGIKDRPCAIVMAATDAEGDIEVLVLPVTHSPPTDPTEAIEIPTPTKQRLGLDGERSWIVISEANAFFWPGPDLRPVPGSDPSSVAYGPLPPKLFAHVRDRFLALDQARKASRVQRTE